MKQEKIKYDFKAFGQAIKEARKVKGLSRNELADQMNIAPCKQSSKVHTFSPANAHFFSASFLAGNGLVVS